MSIELLQEYWALTGGALISAFVFLFIAIRLYRDSARGRLRSRVRELRGRYRGLVAHDRAVHRAEQKLERLTARADKTRPRHLQEARDALEDARSLRKIAQDQVLIAENHVRKLILEEFPPRRQEGLRARHMSRPEPGGKPFTF